MLARVAPWKRNGRQATPRSRSMGNRTATVETTATLDEHHRLQLDDDLPVEGPMRVRVVVKYPLGEESDKAPADASGMGSLSAPEVAEELKRDPNYLAYESEREALESEHEGRYVAYCDGERVALADAKTEIFSLLDTKFPGEPCFVKHIAKVPRRVVFRRPQKMRPAV